MAEVLTSELKDSKENECNQLTPLVYKILWERPSFQKAVISMLENVNKIKILRMLSEECKERQAMHNKRCKHH